MFGKHSAIAALICLVCSAVVRAEVQDPPKDEIRLELDRSIKGFETIRSKEDARLTKDSEETITRMTKSIRKLERRLKQRRELRAQIALFRREGTTPEQRGLRKHTSHYERQVNKASKELAKAFDHAARRYEAAQKDRLALAVLEEKKVFLAGLSRQKDGASESTLWVKGAKLRGQRTEGAAKLEGTVVENSSRRLVLDLTEDMGGKNRPTYRWVFFYRATDGKGGAPLLDLVGMLRVTKKGKVEKQRHRQDLGGQVRRIGDRLEGTVIYSFKKKKGGRTKPNPTDFKIQLLR